MFQRNLIKSVILGCLATPAHAESMPSSPDAVAIILSHPKDKISAPVIEFWRAVADSAAASKAWNLTTNDEIRNLLRGPQLGAVPTVTRDAVAKAHPQVDHWSAKQPKSRSSSGLIRPVQEALDTVAVQGAVIVDCAPMGEHKVRGCGLYFYDRASGKIVAAARKHFRTGVTSAARWAPSMVEGLREGLAARQKEQDNSRLGEIMARTDEPAAKMKFMLGVGGAGDNVGVAGSALSSLATMSITPGFSRAGTGLGLELSTGQTSTGASGERTELAWMAAGLALNVSAEALEIVIWDLTLVAGASRRTFETAAMGRLVATEPFMSLRPGILWNVGGNWTVGANLRFTGWFGGSSQVEETSPSSAQVLAADALSKRSVGTGLLIRKSF